MRLELLCAVAALAVMVCGLCARPINRLLERRLRAKEKRLRRQERRERKREAARVLQARSL